MITTRLRNPLHNLTRTAYDLAVFLRNISTTDFIDVLTEVREDYAAPKESWFWFLFYSRSRTTQLDSTLENLDQEHSSVSQAVTALLSEGGWESTSANTQLLRALLKKLPDYDPAAELSIGILIELKSLLFAAIETQLMLESQIFAEELKLNEIDSKKIALEKELLKKQEELLRKQEEILKREKQLQKVEESHNNKGVELSHLQKECTDKQDELLIFENKLEQIERERVQRENELEATRNKLLLLNPELDIQKMSISEIGSVMEEAKKVGNIAVKTYITEHHEIKRKQEELERMRGQVANAKKQLAGKRIGSDVIDDESSRLQTQQDKEREAVRLQRDQEVKSVCDSRAKGKDASVKSYLERFLKVQMEEKKGEKKSPEQATKQKDLEEKKIESAESKLESKNPGNSKRSIHGMKVRPPQSKNQNFLDAFSLLQANYKPHQLQDASEPTTQPVTIESKRQAQKKSGEKLIRPDATLFNQHRMGVSEVVERPSNLNQSSVLKIKLD